MNKGYIKIALALLSVAGYMQNIAFASEQDPSANSSNGTSTKVLSANPEETEQHLHANSQEAEHAATIMADALNIAKDLAKRTDEYTVYDTVDDVTLYVKDVNGAEVGLLEFTIPNPNCYDNVIDLIWEPKGAAYIDDKFIDGHHPQIYNENLVIIQQRYKSMLRGWQRYFHALATKVELSENETAILMASSNMNDHDGYYTNSTYENPILESINGFCPDVDSQEDIRKGQLYKMYINLMAFFIKKEPKGIKVTHISSVDANVAWILSRPARSAKATKMFNFVKLREMFQQE
ncbi:fam-a protein [Plasmodium chabaudi chabaudi]|uniref:Fam-a protein n=1 Tax=Plasmodium chabaudi chabaudi TaxID=31271 RepID=A0A077TJP1_PLACU|nr:fam-a protein [Plasmodium chabaudi chabaudi]SCL81954.1 fam-a protein [Plasmodium chabaudi chabaudi]VTZ66771.1 fam-a protein [Plasmodium chabaudi chabaudi]|eukprot:XP_016652952.1 fam-a protein [Plasmodium chabaudi chabaudi]